MSRIFLQLFAPFVDKPPGAVLQWPHICPGRGAFYEREAPRSVAEGFSFFLNSMLFGVGLAMDAFSVSVANALADPGMRHARRLRIAGTFALFQVAMPLLGWFCVRTIAESFTAFSRFIPWIALLLLLYIGGQMLLEGVRGGEKETERKSSAAARCCCRASPPRSTRSPSASRSSNTPSPPR